MTEPNPTPFSEVKPPEILTLTSLAPTVENGVLRSKALLANVATYAQKEGLMWDIYESAEPEGINEQREARRLAEYYLLRTALKGQQVTNDRSLWAERFSSASDELYGELHPEHITTIAK